MTLVDGDEEVLATGSGLPRWTAAAGVLAAAGLVAGLLIAHHGHPTAKPAPTPTVPAPVVPVPATLDLAVTPAGTWQLEPHRLILTRPGHAARSVAVPAAVAADGDGVQQLVADPASARIWIVVADGRNSRLAEYDTSGPRLLRVVTWSESVRYAAAYRDRLYLTTDRGAAALAPDANAPQFVPGLSGAVGAVAADPARDRLVLADLGFPTSLWTYRPGGSIVEAEHPVQVSKATFAVVAGRIWLAGFGTDGAVLERLDPTALRPVATSPAVTQFEPGAVVLAAGSRVFWLDASTGTLDCLDGPSGRLVRSYYLGDPNAVASDSGATVVSTQDGVVQLPSPECSGPGHMAGSTVSGHSLR